MSELDPWIERHGNGENWAAWHEKMEKRFQRLMRLLENNKERYVRAWIAATGIRPEDACIVTNMQPNGEVMVVKRRDEVLTCCKCHEPIVKDGLW